MSNSKACERNGKIGDFTKEEAVDRRLLSQIASGDRLAMRTLYARHNVFVYRFVLRLIGDASKAEEVVSDVFFNVWRQAGRFEGRSRVSTWILAIARHKAFSARGRRQEERLEDAAAEDIADPGDDPEQALDRKDRSNLLRGCLAKLCPRHREIIDLVYYHEKSIDEVAAIIGVPPGTVKSRMFYARKCIHDSFSHEQAQVYSQLLLHQ